MNKEVLDSYFKTIIYNKNIIMNIIINYKNEINQNNSNSDVVSSNNKDAN